MLVLDSAPLFLAGRVATQGKLLFDDDPPARVAWEADTRTVYFDEVPYIEDMTREYLRAAGRRGWHGHRGSRGVIDDDLARRVAPPVGFRNVLAHVYAEVDDRRVVANLQRLDELDDYVEQVRHWVAAR